MVVWGFIVVEICDGVVYCILILIFVVFCVGVILFFILGLNLLFSDLGILVVWFGVSNNWVGCVLILNVIRFVVYFVCFKVWVSISVIGML